MILNLGQLSSLATTLAGGRLDWTLSEASLYVNFAYEEIAYVAKHTPRDALAISSTTSGGNRIALPTDFDYSRALTIGVASNSTATTSRLTVWKALDKQRPEWADTYPKNLDGGEPAAYVEYSTWFEIVPSPNSAYSLTLRYATKVPQLVASTDTPILDAIWHRAIALKTTELLEASRSNPEGEMLARNRYLNYVNVIPTDTAKQQRDQRGMRLRFVRDLR